MANANVNTAGKGPETSSSFTAPLIKLNACGVPLGEIGLKLKAKPALNTVVKGGGVSLDLKTPLAPFRFEMPILDADDASIHLFGLDVFKASRIH